MLVISRSWLYNRKKFYRKNFSVVLQLNFLKIFGYFKYYYYLCTLMEVALNLLTTQEVKKYWVRSWVSIYTNIIERLSPIPSKIAVI